MNSTFSRFLFVILIVALYSFPARAQIQEMHRPGDPSGQNLCLTDSNGTLIDSFCQPPGTPAQTEYLATNANEVAMWVGSRNACLTALNGYVRGSNVGLRPCGSSPNQRFQPGIDANIMAGASPHDTPLCLAPTGGSNRSGTPMILWDCTHGSDQMWSARRVGAPSNALPPAPPRPAPAVASLAVNPGDFLSHNGSAAQPFPIGGINAQGQLLTSSGQPIPGAGTGNGFISVQNGRIIASGGGNYTMSVNSASVISTNGSNFGLLVDNRGNPYRIIASGGGNLQVYNHANQIIASGGGNIIASGGGNIIASGGGNIIASGGGNIIAATPTYAAQISHLITNDGATLITDNGGGIDQVRLASLVGNSGGTLLSTNSGTIAVNNGANYSLQSVPAVQFGLIRYVNVPQGSNGRNQCLAITNGHIANGSPSILYDCFSHDPSQTFFLAPDSTIRIGSASGTFCISAFDGLRPGSRVGSYQCAAGDPNQKFAAGPYSSITASNGNLCVGVTNGSNSPGAPLILWSCNRRGTDDQSWTAGPAQ